MVLMFLGKLQNTPIVNQIVIIYSFENRTWVWYDPDERQIDQILACTRDFSSFHFLKVFLSVESDIPIFQLLYFSWPSWCHVR